MPSRRKFALALVAAALSFGCERQPSWETYVSDEGGFSAKYPFPPRNHKTLANSVHGDIEVTFTTANWGRASFSMMVTDYPDEALTSEKEVFDYAVSGVVTELGGEIAAHDQLKLGRYMGRGYELHFARGRVARGQFYLAGRRLYHQQVAYAVKGTDPAAVSKYLDSLRLHPPESTQLSGDRNAIELVQ